MIIKVKDGKDFRIVTEIKRPDPQAVLIIKENKEIEVSNEELHTLISLGYVDVKNVTVISEGKTLIVKAVYPDAIVYEKPIDTPKITVPAEKAKIEVKTIVKPEIKKG